MIKLFVSDMDGTLLNENHVVSDRTAKAVKKLQASGVEFMIATGRGYHSAQVLTTAQAIECRMINLNGASIHDIDGTLTDSNPLLASSVKEMIEFLDYNDIDYAVTTLDNYYISDFDSFVERISKFMNLNKDADSNSLSTTEDILDDDVTNAQLTAHYGDIQPIKNLTLTDENPALKMMVFSHIKDELDAFRQQFTPFEDLDLTSSAADNIEITHSNAQKGLAVEAYVKSKGYTMDEVITIGDSLNDRSMLQMAKHSYAMENAPDHIKAMAKNIAPANYNEGVTKVIEQLLLGQLSLEN